MTELLAPLDIDAPAQGEYAAFDCDTAALLDDVAAYMHADAYEKRRNEAALHRVSVGKPVMFRGNFAFVVDRNPNDATRYELRWFDRHYHVFRQKWISREQFEAIVGDDVAAP